MNRFANCGPRFNTLYSSPSVYNSRTSSPSLTSTSSPSSSATLALDDDQIRALWVAEKEKDTYSDLSSVSTLEDDTSFAGFHNFGSANPLGVFGANHEKALATRERYQAVLRKKAPYVKDLNPRASEFVPLSGTPPPIDANAHPSTPPERLPSWFPIFLQGARSKPKGHASIAKKLATCYPWSLSTIPELAQHLCWTGSSAEDTPHLALFATTIYDEMYAIHGLELADSFLWHLRECCTGTYMAFWDVTYPQAITFQTTDASYIRSALSLTSFMGDLFNQGLLCALQTTSCLQVLVRHIISAEHLQALRALIVHAGRDLWFTHPSETLGRGTLPAEAGNAMIKTFVEDLRKQGKKMCGKRLGILKEPGKGEVQREIDAIVSTLDGWRGR